jgi:NitT/TauT family transport system permease protein
MSPQSRWSRLWPGIILVAAWQSCGSFVDRSDFFFSSPQLVSARFVALLSDGTLLMHTATTTVEIVLGFLFGNVIGSAFGLGLWYSPRVASIVRPYVVALGAVPVLALAPMIVIWFGIGLQAKVVIVGLCTVTLATAQAFEGASASDPKLIEMVLQFGASRWGAFRKVVVPSALSWLFVGYRMNVGMAILGAFVAEFIASSSGLGYLTLRAMGLFDTTTVAVGVLSLCIISLSLTGLLGALQRRVTPWLRVGVRTYPS